MKTLPAIFLAGIFFFFLSSCSTPTPNATLPAATAAATPVPNLTIKVFAPSSMMDAGKELNAAFEAANPGVKVAIEFGHTPTQRLQFTQGATGDVFLAASQKDMDDAVKDETIAPGKPKIFAMNKLVVILPAKNPANLETLADLAKPGTRVLVAVTETPIGKVTLDILDKMEKKFGNDYKAKVLANVVSTESGVKPIVSKIKLGEADAGIVYVTDYISAPELKTLTIPDDLNAITQLNVAPIAKAANSKHAEAYAAFLVSPEGLTILKKWGFLPGK